jgi:hypothetical protein
VGCLDDDDIVIRGGLFPTADDVLTAVTDAFDDGFGAVLSVQVAHRRGGETEDEAVARVCRLAKVPNGKVRLARAGPLSADFPMTQDSTDGQPETHFHVHFPEPPSSVDAQRFVDHFGTPIPNPAKRVG